MCAPHKGTLLQCIGDTIDGTDEYIKTLAAEIDAAKRIFIIGMGRSGLVGRMFAMRLVHLGKDSHIVWDTCTPPIRKGDLLIAISKSGTTPAVLNVIHSAHQHSARIILVTASLEPLVELPLHQIMFVDISPHNGHTRLFPMGTLFEISTLIYFDLIVAEIIHQQQLEESFLKTRHANLE